ncbi:MAG: MFS transporter [SAR202 cluster bacterium]|nr:MFS transporter [SAR202 cluster bacterium]MQG78333.1 MFS transporter [SAR202 cluster bacterium]
MKPDKSAINTPTMRPGRFFYGWWILGLISFMAALNNAFFDKGPALFLIPVGVSLGLNRATSSLIFSLGRSEGALNGPVVGYLVDRFGARKMMVIGTFLAGIGFVIFALAPNLWVFALAYLGFVSLGATMAFQDSATSMVNMWFSRYRVRAMSIREATGNLGSTILIPLMTLVIAIYDWRIAALMGAVAYLVLILPFIPLLKESPESIGLLPDGANADDVGGARTATSDAPGVDSVEALRLRRFYDTPEFTVREALRTSSYWYLLTGTMLRQVSRVGLDLHYIAILEWKGFDLSIAALFFTLRLGMNVPSKLVVGYFGDLVSKPAILSGGMVLYALGLVLLLSSNAVWILVVSAVVSGLSEGITPVNWGAIGDYFGRHHYATLRGIINLSYSWALLFVPFAAGWWFDQHASYTVPIVVSLGAAAASAVVYALMRQPKLPARLAARGSG